MISAKGISFVVVSGIFFGWLVTQLGSYFPRDWILIGMGGSVLRPFAQAHRLNLSCVPDLGAPDHWVDARSMVVLLGSGGIRIQLHTVA